MGRNERIWQIINTNSDNGENNTFKLDEKKYMNIFLKIMSIIKSTRKKQQKLVPELNV